MHWVVVVGVGWLLLAVVGAVVIGCSIRLAERREVPAAAGPAPRPLRSPRSARTRACSPHGRGRSSASRAVSACLSPVDRSPSSWETETT
jgi:hypothetical protein